MATMIAGAAPEATVGWWHRLHVRFMCRVTAYSPFGGRRRSRAAWRQAWKRPEFRAWVYGAMAESEARLAAGDLGDPMTEGELRSYLSVDELRAEAASDVAG